MARWLRNWQTPYTSDAWGAHHMAMAYKELFLAAGYTVNSDDGDPAWTSALNILVDDAGGGGIGTGFEVSAGTPRKIYDTQGRFTQAMVDDECSIRLTGGLLNDDQNQSIWRIVEYIDANHVRVDADGFNPFGWVTDTEVGGKIFKFNGLQLGNGAWALLDSPSPERVQVYIEKNTTGITRARIAPFGKPYAGTAQTGDTIGGAAPNMTLNIAAGKFNKHMVGLNVTIVGATTPANDGTFPITAVSPTGQITYTNAGGVAEALVAGVTTFSVQAISTQVPAASVNVGDYYTNRCRLNAYAEDGKVISYGRNQDSDWNTLHVSKLVGADSEDTDPWFIYGGHNVFNPYSNVDVMWALDGAATPAEIKQFLTFPQQTDSKNEAIAFHRLFGRRVNSFGKTPVREPYVVMDNTITVGACVRGRFPFIRLGYIDFQILRPIDAAGTWLHWTSGMFYPRNGPYDPLPINPPPS